MQKLRWARLRKFKEHDMSGMPSGLNEKVNEEGVSFVRHAMGPCLEKKRKNIAGTSTASNIDQQSPHYLKED